MRATVVAFWLCAVILSGCRVPVSVSSGDDPAAGVPLRWSLNESPRPDGHRIRVYGGTMHSIPSSVRLLGPTGQVVGSASATFSPGAGLCGDTQGAGVAGADVPLPAANVADFRSGWPSGYRIEAEVGGTWLPTVLTHAGCNSTD
jgi:hypothetical protein